MPSRTTQDASGPSLGPLLCLLGVVTLVLAQDIQWKPLGNNQDPGPRAFPMGLAVGLILGGLWEVGRWGVKQRQDGAVAGVRAWAKERFQGLMDPTARDAQVLLIAFVI